MLVSWLRQARSFIATSIYNLYMTMAYPNDGFLFNSTISMGLSTSFYIDKVFGHRIIIDPSNAARVTKVQWCKCLAGSEHEFLLCYLTEATPATGKARPRESVVLIERSAGPWKRTSEDGVVDSGLGIEASGPTPSASSLPTRAISGRQLPVRQSGGFSIPNISDKLSEDTSRSWSKFFKRSSGDAAVFSTTGDAEFAKTYEGGYEVAKGLIFSKNSTFSLLELLALATAVHSAEPDHCSPKFNCYWMAQAIYESLKAIDRFSTDYTYFEPGTFGGTIHPFKDSRPVEEYVMEFEKTWASAQAQIDALPQKRVEEARKARLQAEEARFQAEEENRRLREQLAALQNRTTSDQRMA